MTSALQISHYQQLPETLVRTLMRQLSFFILFFSLTGCVSKNNQPEVVINYNYKGFLIDTLTLKIDQGKFAETIDSLNKPLDTYEELLASEDFQNIFNHSSLYINNVIRYLSDSSKTMGGKTIAIMTMQRKDYQNSLNFLYACDYLYRRDFIDEEILFEILFPRLDLTNADIIKNYKNKQVQNVLIDIRDNSKTTSKFKTTIQDILTGKTYKERKEFLAGQYNILDWYATEFRSSPPNCFSYSRSQ